MRRFDFHRVFVLVHNLCRDVHFPDVGLHKNTKKTIVFFILKKKCIFSKIRPLRKYGVIKYCNDRHFSLNIYI